MINGWMVNNGENPKTTLPAKGSQLGPFLEGSKKVGIYLGDRVP